jgi:hypothetical protein
MDNQEESTMFFEVEEKPADPDGITYDSDDEIRELIRKHASERAEQDYEFDNYPEWLSEVKQAVRGTLFIDFDQEWVIEEQAMDTFNLWREALNHE